MNATTGNPLCKVDARTGPRSRGSWCEPAGKGIVLSLPRKVREDPDHMADINDQQEGR